jgi:hypothetical protein
VKEIREWLESGQDYAQGVALYETHGKSRVVLRSLQYGATEFTRATLRRELEKLAPVTTNVTAAVTTKAGRRPAELARAGAQASDSVKNRHEPSRKLDSSPEKLDSTLEKVESSDELRRARSAWYAERARLHAQLELVATDAERRVMAERILVLSELLAVSYDEPVASDTTQTPDLDSVRDGGEIRRLLANLRPRRSKLKNRPERASDLVQVEAAIQILENNLKRHE